MRLSSYSIEGMAVRCRVSAALLASAVLLLVGLGACQEMELVQVQVVTRHGARVPYQIVATDPTVWDCDLHFICTMPLCSAS